MRPMWVLDPDEEWSRGLEASQSSAITLAI
jgi:hypothetical protein